MFRFRLPGEWRANVMVIDDEQLSLDVMQATLRSIGIDAVCFQDGRVALQEIDQHRPDAIVLDLMMPAFDGFQVLDALQRLPAWREVPVFIWTSMLLTDEEYATLARSARAILIKGGGAMETVLDSVRRWRQPMAAPTGASHECAGPFPGAHPGARSAKGRPVTAPRVLIVDDNAMNIAIAQVVLLAENFEVDTAANGLEAMQKVVPFGPDLILMDIEMPGMNGLEMTRDLKADAATRHIRIVAFTALARQGDEAKMRAAGCDGYLSKPIDVKKFGAQVRACLRAPMGDGAGPVEAIG